MSADFEVLHAGRIYPDGPPVETGLLRLVADLRFALGDNGKRMQPELVEYARQLYADALRYRWLRGGSDIPPHSNRWPTWEVRHWEAGYWNTLFAEKLDAAIDAARSAE